jgi:type I restriction enzyme S subunit
MIKDIPVFIAHNFPSHWKVEEFRWILPEVNETTDIELPLLGANIHLGVTERFEGDGRPSASEDLSKYKLVREGDIIMNPLGKPHGSIGRAHKDGITSPAYWILRVDNSTHSSRYFHYLLRSSMMIAEYVRRSKNLPPNQFDLPWEQFRKIEMPIPPLKEQILIADYLDRNIAIFNKLGEGIPGVRELKNSLITYAVTGEFSIDGKK